MSANITVQEWLDRGYRRYEVDDRQSEIYKRASFMLQKRFDDTRGKRYFITVYCYDRTKYPKYAQVNLPEIGFMPSANFNLGDDKPFFNVQMNDIENIDQVEEYFERFWNMLEKPYYEEFEMVSLFW